MNRLFINDLNATPFSTTVPSTISGDINDTEAMALGDINGDEHPDIVAGNLGEINRLYLNNGTSDPFNGVSGSNLGSEADFTESLSLGDVDGDENLDIISGNTTQQSVLYINNGTTSPFDSVSPIYLLSSQFNTKATLLHDLDHDGDLDLLSALFNQANTLHINDNAGTSFSTQFGTLLSSDTHLSFGLAVTDFDNDGLDDVVIANANQVNRYYTRHWFTSPGFAESLEIDSETDSIRTIQLNASHELPPNTAIRFFVSNNGGQHWFKVRPGVDFTFPTFGADLRWRAHLDSLSPVLSPSLNSINIQLKAVGLTGKDAWLFTHFTQEQLENPFLESSIWGDHADPDDDMQNNYFEYVAGLDPNDSASKFNSNINNSASPGEVEISFSPIVSERSYQVVYRSSLGGTESPLTPIDQSNDGNSRTITDSTIVDENRFYRIEISIPAP